MDSNKGRHEYNRNTVTFVILLQWIVIRTDMNIIQIQSHSQSCDLIKKRNIHTNTTDKEKQKTLLRRIIIQYEKNAH